MISELVGFEGKVVLDKSKPDNTEEKLDTSRLENLGWSAKTNLKEGIKRTLQHYEQEVIKKIIRI